MNSSKLLFCFCVWALLSVQFFTSSALLAKGLAADFEILSQGVMRIEPVGTKTSSEDDDAVGSGFLIHEKGFVVSSFHILQKAVHTKVIFFDDVSTESEAIYLDKKTDLAVIKVSEQSVKHLPVLSWGDSDQVRLGEEAWVLGAPYGMEGSLTRGIISSKHRGIGLVPLEDFLQTDAAINPGNSGGPLLNPGGEVIGVVTAIKTVSGGNAGVNFAVPSRLARFVADQLIESGKVRRGYLGIRLQTKSKTDAAQKDGTGVEVTEVLAGENPAREAGIQKGDKIVELGGQKVRTPREVTVRVSTLLPGSEIAMVVKRGDETLALKIVLGEFPDVWSSEEPLYFPRLAAHVVPLEKDLAIHFGHMEKDIPKDGVLVSKVDSENDKGLKAGDIILGINGKDLNSVGPLKDALMGGVGENLILKIISAGRPVRFMMIRAHAKITSRFGIASWGYL